MFLNFIIEKNDTGLSSSVTLLQHKRILLLEQYLFISLKKNRCLVPRPLNSSVPIKIFVVHDRRNFTFFFIIILFNSRTGNANNNNNNKNYQTARQRRRRKWRGTALETSEKISVFFEHTARRRCCIILFYGSLRFSSVRLCKTTPKQPIKHTRTHTYHMLLSEHILFYCGFFFNIFYAL